VQGKDRRQYWGIGKGFNAAQGVSGRKERQEVVDKTFAAFLPWQNTKIPANLSCLMLNRA
jgi:hypothetical protein